MSEAVPRPAGLRPLHFLDSEQELPTEDAESADEGLDINGGSEWGQRMQAQFELMGLQYST